MSLALFLAVRLVAPVGTPAYRQPQIAVNSEMVAVTFGAGNSVYFAASRDHGKTFPAPVKVSDSGVLPLGRHRGPRLALTSGAIVITDVVGEKGGGADGDLVAWRSTDRGATWSKTIRVTDAPAAAREGLHGLSGNSRGVLLATWLDLRSKGTRLYGSVSRDSGASWSKNKLIYESPDGHICECCHPSALVTEDGRMLAMWRNWLGGSRDMYVATSTDGGDTFATEKQGRGTWPLNACPMDGGGIATGKTGLVTTWRRENRVYLTQAGGAEQEIGVGKDAALALDSRGEAAVVWRAPSGLMAKIPGRSEPLALAADGEYPSIAGTGPWFVAWEDKTGIVIESVSANGETSRWWKHVSYLADDALEGRNTGSEGHRKAAEYVAKQFEAAGLQPPNASGYIQPVKFNVQRLLEDQSSLELIRDGKAEPLKLGEEANISVRGGKPTPTAEAPLYFVGHGLTVPDLQFDDLKGSPLRGKIAVFITGGPSSIPGPLLAHFSSAGERSKFLKAAGVAGTMTIGNPRITDVPWERATLARLQPSMSLAETALDEGGGFQIAVTVNPKHADKILAGSGHTIAELLAIADRGEPLPHFAIPASIRSRVKVETSQVESQNVAGVLPGTDAKLKNEFVAISAHLDHLGVGSALPANPSDKIYNGAMDNASGVASLIDMAQTFHDNKQSFKRSIVFVAVTGEEKGLLGSRYYAAYPTVSGPIVADLNMDMFMPLYPFKILTVMGLDESELGDIAREVATAGKITVQADPEPQRNRFIRSDQYSFIRQGIPSLAFKNGYDPNTPQAEISKKWIAERYHAPSDDLQQPVDQQAAIDFNRLLAKLAATVADRAERPRWKASSFFKRFAKP